MKCPNCGNPLKSYGSYIPPNTDITETVYRHGWLKGSCRLTSVTIRVRNK